MFSEALPAQRNALPIAVDTMGGDLGLSVQVQGAVEAYRDFGLKSILVGPKAEIDSLIDSLGARSYSLEVTHAPETIGMDESPVKAVRKKPDSSLCVAYNLVNEDKAAAIISAGNTGAMMAAGRFLCGLHVGIERPAIATLIPCAGGVKRNIILDAGANVDCNVQHLVQFALMGSIYYTALFCEEKPRVGLLSNGSEESKGNDLIRATSAKLRLTEGINYIGYVEGRDVPLSVVDVIVCDGFVGNIVLKSMEGCVRLIADQLKHESEKGLFKKLSLGLSKGVLKNMFKEQFDYSAYGGAPLLGLTKLALVLHGSSNERAVKNAIRAADNFSALNMTEKIGKALGKLEEQFSDDVSVQNLGEI